MSAPVSEPSAIFAPMTELAPRSARFTCPFLMCRLRTALRLMFAAPILWAAQAVPERATKSAI